MKKLAAFTITELMVVSLLGTVCAAAAFTGLQVIQDQYFSYEKESNRILELGELQRQLQADVLLASEVYREEEGIGLSLPHHEIHYVLGEQSLDRVVALDGVRKKTFPLQITAIQSYFKGERIEEGKLDFFKMTLLYDAAECSLSFEKNYSAREKMRTIH